LTYEKCSGQVMISTEKWLSNFVIHVHSIVTLTNWNETWR